MVDVKMEGLELGSVSGVSSTAAPSPCPCPGSGAGPGTPGRPQRHPLGPGAAQAEPIASRCAGGTLLAVL